MYLCNDSLEDRAGEITLCLTDTRGQIKWRRHARAKAKANSSQPVFFADAQELDPLFGTDCLLLCDVSESLGGDRALWIPDSIGSLKRPAPQVRVLSAPPIRSPFRRTALCWRPVWMENMCSPTTFSQCCQESSVQCLSVPP